MHYPASHKTKSRAFRPTLSLLTFAAAAFPMTMAHATGTLAGLGTLGGTYSPYTTGISPDGSLVVGASLTAGGIQHATLWDAGSVVDLTTLAGFSEANGVSNNGVVVGGGFVNGIMHALIRTGGSTIDIGTLAPGGGSSAHGVSADGSVVVGGSFAGTNSNGTPLSHAFSWSVKNMTDLGVLGGVYSSATAVSYDGSAVVGFSSIDTTATIHAVLWKNGNISDLGTLGKTYSVATSVSAYGSVVVGYAYNDPSSNLSRAFRWDNTFNTMTDLGTLGGATSVAIGVSSNGNVIVGSSTVASGVSHAFRWTQTVGMQDVVDWLTGEGVSLPTGVTLAAATATNSDGSVLVGNAASVPGIPGSTAWIARVSNSSSHTHLRSGLHHC